MDLWEQNIAESRQAAIDRARECDPDRLPVWPPTGWWDWQKPKHGEPNDSSNRSDAD